MGVVHIRNQFKKQHPEVELHEGRLVYKCCREIRIQMPWQEGKVYHGYNTITEEHEDWLCIRQAKDYNFSQLQRIIGLRV